MEWFVPALRKTTKDFGGWRQFNLMYYFDASKFQKRFSVSIGDKYCKEGYRGNLNLLL